MAKKSNSQGLPKIIQKPWNPTKRYITNLNYLGLVFALAFYVFSMLPSLLPRTSLIQGLVTGISIAAGYGVGVLVSHLIRWFTEYDVPKKYKPYAWRAYIIIAPIIIVIFGALGKIWHDEVRELVGLSPDNDFRLLVVLFFASLIFVLILALSRAIRKLFRFLFNKIDLILPRRVSYAISFVFVTILLFWTATGVLGNAFISVANTIYGNKDSSIPEGYYQPTSALRSGSPESLSTWDTIGYQGRKFVAGGPTVEDISDFSGQTAQEPIRIYIGLQAAPTAEDRAALAVEELKRTGAFDRDVLVMANTTGSGWLEPASIDPIEYMYNGNTAIVSQQYSYLPSWISYLVDAETATQAGQALYDAVYAAWSELPTDERPKLIAYGLSLGSFGGQTPYSGINDLRLSIDGALFQGTPNFTTLWRNTTDNRDPGTPEWQPTYKDGVTVRFASTSEDITKDQSAWSYPRVLYMQHASDPVVWFDFSLVTNKPDWLREPRGPDVSPATRWYPIVSFVQLGIDQIMAAAVPVGHGHQYGNTVAEGWSSVANPPNWSQEKTDALQELINNKYLSDN